MNPIDKRLKEIDERLHAKLKQIDEKLLSSAPDRSRSSSPPQGKMLHELRVPKPEEVQGLKKKPFMEEQDLLQAAAYVFHAPHVTSNESYHECASLVLFRPLMDESLVNAMATYEERLIGEKLVLQPVILYYGGDATSARLMALAYAVARRKPGQEKELLTKMATLIAKEMIENEGCLPLERTISILEKAGIEGQLGDEYMLRDGQSFGFGAVVGTIAHELGHHALGHVSGPRENMEISRNQEREADLFASSVVSSSPFGEYLVPGYMLSWLPKVWLDHLGDRDMIDTHPISIERILNFIRSNLGQAERYGFGEKDIEDYLPKEWIKRTRHS